MDGMSSNQDGDAFFDDDFLDIPDDELQKLEQDAITFTQQEHGIVPSQSNGTLSNGYSAPYAQHVDDLTRSRPSTFANPTKHPNITDKANQGSSVGTLLDEDGLPLVVEEQVQAAPQRRLDETTEREHWRLNRFGPQHGQAQSAAKPLYPPRPLSESSRQPTRRSLAKGLATSIVPTDQDRDHHNALQKSIDDDALRARIAELTRERDELKTNLSEAKDEVLLRRGEILNIRAKQENDGKAHQRQLVALQKLKQDESDKHLAVINTMKAENTKVASEIKFLQQELKEESRKTQTYQRQLKDRPLADKLINGNTTPKRSHTHRDGFDDDELAVISPVKSGRRSKPGTPTANRKRKQPAGTDTNAQPLPLRLSGTGGETQIEANTMLSKPNKAGTILRKDHTAERHMRLIQRVTDFRLSGSQKLLMQRLFQLSFPTEPSKTLGDIAAGAIAKLEGPRIPGDLIQIFIDMWSRAHKENYHVCISLMVEVISYIIDQDPLIIDATLLNDILPIIQSTVDINARVRFMLVRKDHLNHTSEVKPKINHDINNTSCLDLLYTIACLVSDDGELISLFWRSLSCDFVLLVLNGCQPIPDITLMLRILATSILPNTFAMICEASQQEKYEQSVCTMVFYTLWETPKPDSGKPPYSDREICLLRQEALDLLTQLAIGSSPNPSDPSTAENHGTKILVNHPTAISRLVRSIYDELAVAYHMTRTQHLRIQLVNSAVRILHFVLFSPAGRQVVWQSKFVTLNGGAHKFRVAMARLFYADDTDPGIDAGVTDDTVRRARELLEECVTPDEAEDIVRVFTNDSSGNASRRVSAMGSTQH